MTSHSSAQYLSEDQILFEDQTLPEAAMEFPLCLVCSYDIVDEGYTLDCGHAMHSECFEVFLQIEIIECDECANAQWYFSNGEAYDDYNYMSEEILSEQIDYEPPISEPIHGKNWPKG